MELRPFPKSAPGSSLEIDPREWDRANSIFAWQVSSLARIEAIYLDAKMPNASCVVRDAKGAKADRNGLK
jgi:hypothetical protein